MLQIPHEMVNTTQPLPCQEFDPGNSTLSEPAPSSTTNCSFFFHSPQNHRQRLIFTNNSVSSSISSTTDSGLSPPVIISPSGSTSHEAYSSILLLSHFHHKCLSYRRLRVYLNLYWWGLYDSYEYISNGKFTYPTRERQRYVL